MRLSNLIAAPFALCLSCSFFSSSTLNAQIPVAKASVGRSTRANLIKMRPEATQGFLVLDKSADARITSWKIDIYKDLPEGGTASASAPTPEITYTLREKNYQLIPKEYFRPGASTYSYKIRGYNSEDKELATQGPEKACVGCGTELIRSWTCEGKTYAWEVQYSKNLSGTKHYMTLLQAVDNSKAEYGISIPYYQWGDATFKNYVCSSAANRARYGVSGVPGDCSNVNGTNSIITGFSTYPNYLLDERCAPTYGDVFGVNKYLDSWYEAAGKTVEFDSPPSLGTSMSEMLDYVAMYDVFGLGSENQLGCISCGVAPSWPGVTDGIDWAEHYENVINCLFLDCEEWDDWWNMVSTIAHAVGGESTKINDEITWYSGLVAINIARVDERGMNTSLGKDNFFNTEGKLIAPPLRFEKGLYKVEFVRENNTRLPFYAEVKTPLDYSLKESDLFKATIYPVPITGSSFSIDMKTYARLDVTYTLYDPAMAAIVTKTFNLAKDYTGTASFRLTASPAPGNYTHVFTFADGSKKSFITPKP